MKEFVRKIITGNPRALMYAKSLLTDPALTFNIEGSKIYIPLEVETYQRTGDAEVSEQLVVTSEGKKWLTDNVAPGPWSWTISGYISGIEAGELSNYYTPGVRFNIEIIKKAYWDGMLAFFKDPDCWPFDNVVIQSLTLETRSDCKNKKPFQMVLKQVEILQAEEGTVSRLVALSNPPEGSEGGLTLSKGQTAVTNVDLKSKAFTFILE